MTQADHTATAVAALNAAHALDSQLRFVSGPGGLALTEIANAHGQAQVALQGAHVLRFRPHSAEQDALFLSRKARFAPGLAIRGGVPVCWPWFGPDPQGLGRPNHGLARTRPWSVAGTAALPDGQTRLVLRLTDTPDTRRLWPHRFELTLAITVGARLHLELVTRNTGKEAFGITQALHSYLAVGDVAQARVSGLHGCRYTDKTTGAPGQLRQQGDVVFDAEVDRVYAGVPDHLCVHDAAWRRSVSIRSEGSRTAVVWNPGAVLAAGMADLQDDEYQRFVCVETANAGDETVTLAPGAQHRLVADLGWQPEAG